MQKTKYLNLYRQCVSTGTVSCIHFVPHYIIMHPNPATVVGSHVARERIETKGSHMSYVQPYTKPKLATNKLRSQIRWRS